MLTALSDVDKGPGLIVRDGRVLRIGENWCAVAALTAREIEDRVGILDISKTAGQRESLDFAVQTSVC